MCAVYQGGVYSWKKSLVLRPPRSETLGSTSVGQDRSRVYLEQGTIRQCAPDVQLTTVVYDVSNILKC